MSIKQRAKDMWVSDLVRKIEKLEEENADLREKVNILEEELEKAHIAYRAVRKVNSELMNWYV